MSYKVEIQDAANVTAIIDFDFAYASQKEFDDHVNADNPHPNFPNHLAEISSADFFWATDNDSNLHKISLENAKTVLLTEVNEFLDNQKIIQADLEKFRKFQKLGLDVKFISENILDETKVKVLSSAKNGLTLELATLEDLEINQHYRLSDGINSEIVQLAGLGFGENNFFATLATPLMNDFDNNNLFLYRTNESFGQRNSDSWQGEIFSGIEAGDIRETSISQWKDF